MPGYEGEMSGRGGQLQSVLCLLGACRTPSHLAQLQAQALKTRLDADAVVAGKLILIAAVTLEGTLPHALRLFSSLPAPARDDPFIYNALIRGLAESDQPAGAVAAYSSMRRAAVPPDSFTFAFALKGAANARSCAPGRQLHAQAALHGLDSHIYVATTLVSMYAECGQGDAALRIFDEMPQRNVVAWNAAITARLRCDDVAGAEALFSRMPARNSTSWNLLLAGHIRSGELPPAARIFHQMPEKDPVSWSTMITGHARDGDFEEAFLLFRESLRARCRPNEVTLTAVLSACAHAGALVFARSLHARLDKAGLRHLVAVGNALLDAYAKCGELEMARRVFYRWMEKRSVVSWTAMVAGLAMHGRGEEAVRVFREMEEQGTRPDGVAFVTLLYACSHGGLVEKGYHLFCMMEERYGIEPSVEHYGCMVDMYARAGRLEEAYQFVLRMPARPNAVVWRTVLGACSVRGDVAMAERVERRLAELEPGDAGDHVLLSNTYAAAGRWEDAAVVRTTMSRRRIKKPPGWSAVEVGTAVYRFVAGEDQSGEAEAMLAEIMSRLAAEGYVPEVARALRDVEEEEKQLSVARHSEKLAVAFGLARACPGAVIRVVKNLRVCTDCHSVMKLISKVYRREIVLRDRSRFHTFVEGSCSCGDFW